MKGGYKCAMKTKWWDAKRLEYESDIETVAASLGLPRDRSGSYKCPNPEHNDTHYGNCYLTRDKTGIVCYVCKSKQGRNKVWSPISLLTECYGFKFPDACEYLANLTGCPERYVKNPPNIISSKTASNASPTYVLSKNEQELLGIDNGRMISIPVESYGKQRPPKEKVPLGWHVKEFDHDVPDDEPEAEFVIMKPTQVNFMDYSMVGADVFKEIVRGKCLENMAKRYMLIKEMTQPLSYPQYARMHVFMKEFGIEQTEFKKIFQEEINQIWKIYTRFGGNPNETVNGIIEKYNAIVSAYKEGV